MEERYSRSVGTLTVEEIEGLKKASVMIVGSGGLGGIVLELLGRLGVGHISVIDGDIFVESNLNRQILCTTETLGQKKVDAAKARMALVNHQVIVTSIDQWLTANNAYELLKGHDLVIDALDHIDTRFVVQEVCERLDIPLIHGAIGGWYGQVAVIFPKDRLLDKLYKKQGVRGIEASLGNPSFTPTVVASIQAAEAIKVLIGRGDVLRHQVLRIDLLQNDYTVIEMT